MLAMLRFLWVLLSKPGGGSSVFLTSVVWEEIIACLLKLPLGFFRELASDCSVVQTSWTLSFRLFFSKE